MIVCYPILAIFEWSLHSSAVLHLLRSCKRNACRRPDIVRPAFANIKIFGLWRQSHLVLILICWNQQYGLGGLFFLCYVWFFLAS